MSSALHSLSVSALSAVHQRIICALTIYSSIPLAAGDADAGPVWLGTAAAARQIRRPEWRRGIITWRVAGLGAGHAVRAAGHAGWRARRRGRRRGAVGDVAATAALGARLPGGLSSLHLLLKGTASNVRCAASWSRRPAAYGTSWQGFGSWRRTVAGTSIVVKGKFLPEQGSHAVQMATPMTFTPSSYLTCASVTRKIDGRARMLTNI